MVYTCNGIVQRLMGLVVFFFFVALLFFVAGAVDGVGVAVDASSGLAADGPAAVDTAFFPFFLAGAEVGKALLAVAAT